MALAAVANVTNTNMTYMSLLMDILSIRGSGFSTHPSVSSLQKRSTTLSRRQQFLPTLGLLQKDTLPQANLDDLPLKTHLQCLLTYIYIYTATGTPTKVVDVAYGSHNVTPTNNIQAIITHSCTIHVTSAMNNYTYSNLITNFLDILTDWLTDCTLKGELVHQLSTP